MGHHDHKAVRQSAVWHREDYINMEDTREYSRNGNKAYLVHNVPSEGQMVQMTLASHDKKANFSDYWQRIVRANYLKRLFQDWLLHLYKAVNEVRN